ncbi:MAG: hypothetical protein A2289_10990 [Deltaproteobacteria bacterium RIFOXYA12_FULL_58_15]|nr:MAG: hypothetical protein A2289_10990 [Deltaproteobacteria bacterium RIFOXYA12_FULL_58_15]OGR12917.1 MAG: hypothetical protein A2341_09175 [Deltaproteobacteria bacterium RIFOXYB12_FULL_58_9]
MASFSRKPPAPSNAQDFIAAADHLPTPEPALTAEAELQPKKKEPRSQASARQKRRPWEGLDPKATPKNVFNLRLNDYHLAILRHLAEQDEDASMQRICKKILLPEIERRIQTK